MKGILMFFYRFIVYLLNDLFKFIYTIVLKIVFNLFLNSYIYMIDFFKMYKCICYFVGINICSFCYLKKVFYYKIFIL